METLTFLGIVLLLVVFLFIWSTRAPEPLKGVPEIGPRKFWFGHALIFRKKRSYTHDFTAAMLNKNKTHFSFTVPLGIRGLYLYPNETTIKHIMKDRFENYILPPVRLDSFGELFGRGIFTSNGDRWRMQRKAASHIFSLGRLRSSMSAVFLEHGLVLIQCLTDHKSQEFDAQDLFLKYTLDSFAKIAFGEEINSLVVGNAPIAVAYDQAQLLMLPRLWDRLWKLKRFLNIGREAQLRGYLTKLEKYSKEIITRRRQEMEQGTIRQDLIYEFLKAAEMAGEPMSDSDIRDVLMNFLVAGRDTTATALTWFFYEMTQHPDIQAKVAEECQAALNGDPSNATFEAVESLKYTYGALMEAIRLHPPVPSDMKQAVEDDTLPDGTFIPQGAIVNFHPYASGRSEELWGDPLNFRPERWEEKHSEYKFPHFNAGLRVCLGKTLALLEAKIAIAMLLCKFKFTLAEGHPPVHYAVNVTLTAKGGMWLVPHPI